jgi:hypothetical protein
MTETVGIRAVCGRVLLMMSHRTGTMFAEMTVKEARLVRQALDHAIDTVASGASSSDSLAELLDRI